MVEDKKPPARRTWWDIVIDEILEVITPHIKVRPDQQPYGWVFEGEDEMRMNLADTLQSIIEDYHARP